MISSFVFWLKFCESNKFCKNYNNYGVIKLQSGLIKCFFVLLKRMKKKKNFDFESYSRCAICCFKALVLLNFELTVYCYNILDFGLLNWYHVLYPLVFQSVAYSGKWEATHANQLTSANTFMLSHNSWICFCHITFSHNLCIACSLAATIFISFLLDYNVYF